MIAKGSLPFSCVRIAPVLPQARQAEGRAVLHGNSVRLLGPRALNGPPLEEAVDRHEAAPLSISFAKCGELGNALGLGIDGPTPSPRVCEPMRDQTPLDAIERALTRLAVLPNNEQLLAGCSVVPGPNVPHPAVADLEAIDDGEVKRTGALDDTAAHR